MIPGEISARISDVHDELKKLLTHLNEFPDPEAIKRVHGSRTSVARPFGVDLSAVAQVASSATSSMMKELAEMDSTIRTALDDLTEQDAALAVSAQRFESFLDDATEAAEQPASEPAAPASPASTEASHSFSDRRHVKDA